MRANAFTVVECRAFQLRAKAVAQFASKSLNKKKTQTTTTGNGCWWDTCVRVFWSLSVVYRFVHQPVTALSGKVTVICSNAAVFLAETIGAVRAVF